MKRLLFLCSMLVVAGGTHGQNLNAGKKLVDLQGQSTTTVITNGTADTLRLQILTMYHTPYSEVRPKLTIPPGKTDSVMALLAFPDFIHEQNYDLRFYNAPGRRILVRINSIKKGAKQIEFAGDLIQENNYYTAYNNYFKGTTIEDRIYYTEGAKFKDLNSFPKAADSINNLALGFLKKYTGPLPDYFRPFEESRLVYNAAYRKYNVLFDRYFKTGRTNLVEPSYFDFDKTLPFIPPGLILNSSYMNYAGFSILYRSGLSRDMSRRFTTLDSLTGVSEPADALKMNLMSALFRQSKPLYDSIVAKLAFFDVRNKYTANSMITLESGLPRVGRPVPPIKLVNLQGDSISLADFKGKPVIINFWASWCGACLQEFPNENALHAKYSPQGLVVVNICVDTNRKQWELLSRVKDLRMINLYVTAEEYKRLKMRYNIESMPRSILVSKNGHVLNNYYKPASLIKDAEIEELLTAKD